MNNNLIRIAKYFYNRIPYRWARNLMFSFFLILVRGKRVVKEVDGILYDLDLGEMMDVCIYLEKCEDEVARAIQRYCVKGWKVLDIGANIGAHALRFSKCVGREGSVYAFEPMSFAYNKLLSNMRLNRFCANTQAFNIALSDENASCKEIDFRSSWRTDGGRADLISKIDFVRLDDWCEQNGVKSVNLIKLDVDGNEYSVLAGGRNLLTRFRPLIFMEVGAWQWSDNNRNPLALLFELGYKFKNLSTGRSYLKIEDFRQDLPEQDNAMTCSLNVMALPIAEDDVPYVNSDGLTHQEEVLLWRSSLSLCNFINSYYQYRDIASIGEGLRVLLVGVGQGLDPVILKWKGYHVETLDIENVFKPDHLGSVDDLSDFEDKSFDVVVASHVLEHLPFGQFDKALEGIARVGDYAIIYLPVTGRHAQLRIQPGFGDLDFSMIFDFCNKRIVPDDSRPILMQSQHYWEIGSRGCKLRDVEGIFKKHFDILNSYRNRDWLPSHNFVLRTKS